MSEAQKPRSRDSRVVGGTEGAEDVFPAGTTYQITFHPAAGGSMPVGSAESACTTSVEGVECGIKLALIEADLPAGFPATVKVGDGVCVESLCGVFQNK